MALGTATVAASTGRSPSRPLTVDKITFLADASYPTGGTAAFLAFVRTALARTVNIIAVEGYTVDATPVMLFRLHYDAANDKLMMFSMTAGLQASAADHSASTVHCTVTSE